MPQLLRLPLRLMPLLPSRCSDPLEKPLTAYVTSPPPSPHLRPRLTAAGRAFGQAAEARRRGRGGEGLACADTHAARRVGYVGGVGRVSPRPAHRCRVHDSADPPRPCGISHFPSGRARGPHAEADGRAGSDLCCGRGAKLDTPRAGGASCPYAPLRHSDTTTLEGADGAQASQCHAQAAEASPTSGGPRARGAPAALAAHATSAVCDAGASAAAAAAAPCVVVLLLGWWQGWSCLLQVALIRQEEQARRQRGCCTS